RRLPMLKRFALGASVLALAVAAAQAAEAPLPADDSVAVTTAAGGDTLVGPDAFTSWEDSRPGVTRLIRPEDLPEPFLTKSASNAPGLAAMPADAMPEVPPGFAVEMVAS